MAWCIAAWLSATDEVVCRTATGSYFLYTRWLRERFIGRVANVGLHGILPDLPRAAATE
jgi:hypothetical protein